MQVLFYLVLAGSVINRMAVHVQHIALPFVNDRHRHMRSETERRIIVPVGQHRTVPDGGMPPGKLPYLPHIIGCQRQGILSFAVLKQQYAVGQRGDIHMQLLAYFGQQPPVYPPDRHPLDTVGVEFGPVRHKHASFVRRCLIRIHNAVERDSARFLCQVGIFEQFYGIIDEIRFRFSQCHTVGRHHHLLVLEARSYVGHTASGQQQVVPVDPSTIPGLLPLFQPSVFQDGGVILDQLKPVAFALDDQKRIHIVHGAHFILPARTQVGCPRLVGKDNPRVMLEQRQAAGGFHAFDGIVPYIFAGDILHACKTVYRSAGRQTDNASANPSSFQQN